MDELRKIEIRDYLKVIYKRKIVIAAIFLIISAVLVTSVYMSTPLYKATTEVIIEKTEQHFLPSNMYYTPFDPEFYATQHQIIKSPAVGRKVVELTGLDKTYRQYMVKPGFSPFALFSSIKSFLTGSGSSETPAPGQMSIETLGEIVSAGISVRPLKDSRIVHISYTSPYPEFASMVANSAAQAYIEQILEMKLESSRYTLDWMTQKAREEFDRLGQSEKEMTEHIRTHDIITIENRLAVIPEQLKQLSFELTSAEAKLAQLEAVNETLFAIENPEDLELFPLVASAQSMQGIRAQILQTEQKVIELSKQYGEKHPIMLSVRKELNELEKKKTVESGKIAESIRREYELAKATASKLRQRLNETKAEALLLNEKFMQYETLKKEVDINRQLYDALLTRIKEQNIQEQFKGVNIWILREAKVPSRPISPDTSRDVPVSLLFSLFAGLATAFVLEFLDNTVKNREDAEDKLGVPVLGLVPALKGDSERIGLISPDSESSHIGEFYKAIRTSILLSSAEAHPKTLLITSAEPKEGKTTTSINLAYAIAQYGRSVVLIDADLRKPAVHSVLDLENHMGLSTYLTGASDLKVNSPGNGLPDNLHIVTAGPPPPNPSELLGSGIMGTLIDELKHSYDFIVLDSPPMGTMTDASILSKLTDGTVFVIMAEKTNFKSALRGLKSLGSIGAHLLGVVVNGVELSRQDYYYNYYYSSSVEKKR